MDPITLIVTAIAAGAAVAAEGVAADAVRDAYAGFKTLVIRNFGTTGAVEANLQQVEAEPLNEVWQAALQQGLTQAGADVDQAILSEAQSLLDLIAELHLGDGPTYHAHAEGSGAIAQDNSVAAGERGVAAKTIISSIIATGDHNRFFAGDYERLRDAFIEPWPVFERVNLDRFSGRKWLVTKVDAFLSDNDRGYFVLEANAGLGKTTFMAWLVKQRGYVHHFVEQAPGQEGIGPGLKNLSAQLALAYHLEAWEAQDALPAAATRPDYLWRVLKLAAAARPKGSKVVLVVDALDEAGTPTGQNVLGLPQVLPEGVYIIASQRPVPVTLQVDTVSTPRHVESLEAHSEGNIEDMERYLQSAATGSGIAGVLVESKCSAERFVETMKVKSQGVWIYLHFVINEIEQGQRSILDLDELPNGITQYYIRYWQRWRDKNETTWYDVYLPLLATLAAAQEAVNIERLVALTGVTWTLPRLRRLLNEQWRPFLATSPMAGETLYRFYHATLDEFFNGKVESDKLNTAEESFIQELSGATTKAHGRVADRYLTAWGGLAKALPGLQEAAKRDIDGGYGLRHLARHLALRRALEKLRHLLFDFGWLQAKLEATSVQALLQDYAHLPDDEEARVVHEAIKRSAQVLSQDSTQLAGQLLGRLQARPETEIQALLHHAIEWRAAPWLRPLLPSLIPPGDPLLLTLSGHEGTVRSIAVTPDGRWGVTADNSSKERLVRLWDFITGTELHTLPGLADSYTFNPLSITSGGRWALVASGGGIGIWNVNTGERKTLLQGHASRITALAVAANGRQAASGAEDGSLVAWNLVDFQKAATLPVQSESIEEIAMTADGRYAVTLTEKAIKLWDLQNQQEMAALLWEGGPSYWYSRTPLALSSDGKRVYFGSPLRLWHVERPASQHLLPNHDFDRVLAVTPSGNIAITLHGDHRTLDVWDVEHEIRRAVMPTQGSDIATLVFTPDGRTVVAAMYDHYLKVWALEHTAESVAVAFPGDKVDITSDGRWAISGGKGKVIAVWDMETGRRLSGSLTRDAVEKTIRSAWQSRDALRAKAKAFTQQLLEESPDRKQVIENNSDVVAADNGNRAITYLLEPNKTSEGEESGAPSKRYALTLWDITAPDSEPVPLMGHSSPVMAVAMTPDGHYAVSSCIGRTVRVWDLKERRALRALPGHGGTVWGVQITPDGHYAVSASEDRTVRVWNLDTGGCVAIYTNDLPMRHCAVSDDGSAIVASDLLGRVHLMRLEALP